MDSKRSLGKERKADIRLNRKCWSQFQAIMCRRFARKINAQAYSDSWKRSRGSYLRLRWNISIPTRIKAQEYYDKKMPPFSLSRLYAVKNGFYSWLKTGAFLRHCVAKPPGKLFLLGSPGQEQVSWNTGTLIMNLSSINECHGTLSSIISFSKRY